MPGVVLQANYIQSLLDGRYLTPVPSGRAFLLNFALALGLGWIFFKMSLPKKVFVIVPMVPFSLIIPWMLTYLLATYFGYYLAIWFPGGALIGLWAGRRQLKTLERISGGKLKEGVLPT